MCYRAGLACQRGIPQPRVSNHDTGEQQKKVRHILYHANAKLRLL